MNLELFPCSGGFAEGLRRAGITIDMAFDFDDDACDSYAANLGHRPVQMDVLDLLRMVRAGWRPGPVDLLVADPPCTPWSLAGKRQGLEDERDMLRPTVELIELLRPRCWLVANVPGLDNSDNWQAVVRPLIGGMAQRLGYCVDYASLDAADFGVPQHRRRPFWWGHPVGTPCIQWPTPTHCAPPVLPGIGLRTWVTCREALGHLSREELGKPMRLRRRGKKSADPGRCGTAPRASWADEPAGTLTTRENGDGNVLSLNPKHPSHDAEAPANMISGSDGGGSKRVLEWPWDRPATTIVGDERLNAAGHHDPEIPDSQHGEQAILLSERAGAILQGFPESWVLAGKTKRSRWSMIGQATPPSFAEAVGRAIAAWMSSAESPQAHSAPR